MAIGPSDQRPATQRVGSGRRVPVVISAIVVLVVGTLIWKPWEQPTPAPSTASTIRPNPLSTTPSEVAEVPTASPSPSSTDAPVPTATAQATVGPVRPQSTPYLLTTPRIECHYVATRDGRRLEFLSAAPAPIVVHPAQTGAKPIRRVGWRLDVEVNQQDKVFTRGWQPVGHTKRSSLSARTGWMVALPELPFGLEGETPDQSQIYRVSAVIYWWEGGRRPVGSLTLPVRRYVDSDRAATDVWTDGCPAQSD